MSRLPGETGMQWYQRVIGMRDEAMAEWHTSEAARPVGPGGSVPVTTDEEQDRHDRYDELRREAVEAEQAMLDERDF